MAVRPTQYWNKQRMGNWSPKQRFLDTVTRAVHKGELIQLPYYEVQVDGKPLRYSGPPESPLIWGRVQTLYAKEPTTIPYLESFDASDLMLDIGANVGMYSMYAAVVSGCEVVAVEPESLNFAELNKNVYLNGLHGRVTPICAAATDERKIDRLNLGTFGIGYAFHDFGENTWKNDQKWTPEVTTKKDRRVQQGCMGITIDELISSGFMRVPDHIKVDVDGIEHRVIAGAHNTLRDPRVKTVLIELDHTIEHSQGIFDLMLGLGWKYSEEQLITNRNLIMKKERARELRKIGKDGFNYIFFRDDRYFDLFSNFLDGYQPTYTVQNKIVNPPKLVDLTKKA